MIDTLTLSREWCSHVAWRRRERRCLTQCRSFDAGATGSGAGDEGARAEHE